MDSVSSEEIPMRNLIELSNNRLVTVTPKNRQQATLLLFGMLRDKKEILCV